MRRKAKGIRVWVIVFATVADDEPQLLRVLEQLVHRLSNSTQLNAAFQEIAKQVGELRVVR